MRENIHSKPCYCGFIEAWKKVGIASNSHRAIEHLLEASLMVAKDKSVEVRAVKISGDPPEQDTPYQKLGAEYFKDTGAFYKSEFGSYNLIAGTAWLYSDGRSIELVDYLFIDEAGQICLANVVAMSSAAKNIVLIGDQMQLEQPIKVRIPVRLDSQASSIY